MSVKEAEKLRIAVEKIFKLKYYKIYSPETLDGANGIVQNICQDLGYFHPSTIRRVVVQVHEAIEEEKEFIAEKKKYENEK